MIYKSIEIYYDIASIPGCDGSNPEDPRAVPFRDDARELITDALAKARLGTPEGAEIGMGEVNFGFEVRNCELAEAMVRKAVQGTPFAGIREIVHFEDTLEDLMIA
ncbi:MAG: hypothetical protein AAGB18_08595 [Pseudomonadota bacterium]